MIYAEDIFLFSPPKGWKIAPPNKNTSYIQVGYIKNSAGLFRPSLNYAKEKTDLSLLEYIQSVKKIYASQKEKQISDMGNITTDLGPARLLMINTSSPAGKIKLFQSIVVYNHMAHILTGSTLLEDFSQYYSVFLHAFTSMRIIDDLFSEISPTEKQDKLRSLYRHIHTKQEYQCFEKKNS